MKYLGFALVGGPLGRFRVRGIMLQRTLKNRISCTGIGLHTGVSVSLTLHPAPADTGIWFLRSDVAPGIARVQARWDRVKIGRAHV